MSAPASIALLKAVNVFSAVLALSPRWAITRVLSVRSDRRFINVDNDHTQMVAINEHIIQHTSMKINIEKITCIV